jgi:hypothetical protein
MPAVFSRPQVIVGPHASLRQNPLDFVLQVMTNTNPADVPTDPDEREAFHEALHGKYISSITIRAPEVRSRLLEILKKSDAPKKWTSLIRSAYINGAPTSEFKGKPEDIESWVMGYELRMRDDHFLWACLAVDDEGWLYAYHSISVYADGRLVGQSPTGDGSNIDLKDVNRILDAWSNDVVERGSIGI